jgi:hypothetical protein
VLVSVAAVWVAGCASEGGKQPISPAVTHPVLTDVPLPAGFRLVDDRSRGVASGSTRVGKWEFHGPTDRTSVVEFFKEYMPTAGFKLKMESFDRGVYSLNYESSAEICTLRIQPEKGKTAIVVDIVPYPRGTIDRESRANAKRTPPADE